MLHEIVETLTQFVDQALEQCYERAVGMGLSIGPIWLALSIWRMVVSLGVCYQVHMLGI